MSTGYQELTPLKVKKNQEISDTHTKKQPKQTSAPGTRATTSHKRQREPLTFATERSPWIRAANIKNTQTNKTKQSKKYANAQHPHQSGNQQVRTDGDTYLLFTPAGSCAEGSVRPGRRPRKHSATHDDVLHRTERAKRALSLRCHSS